MSTETTEDFIETYTVVVNLEEQYSIWPADRELPAGWSEAGRTGTKAECLAWIEEHWTDMRPLSLRKAMEAAALAPPAPAREAPVDDLVDRLCVGRHLVEITSPRPEESLREGYIHLRFPNTRGGTELGLRLDQESTLITTHVWKLASTLTLNFERVRCFAEIAPETGKGEGWLERC